MEMFPVSFFSSQIAHNDASKTVKSHAHRSGCHGRPPRLSMSLLLMLTPRFDGIGMRTLDQQQTAYTQ